MLIGWLEYLSMAELTTALERARQRALGGGKQKAVKPPAIASVQPTQ